MSGVTLFEAAARLARVHAGRGWSELNAGEQLAVVHALNAGLSQFWQVVPSIYRRQPLSLSANERAGVSVSVTAGSADVGAATFTASEIGRTLQFPSGDDGAWHRVGDTSALELAWGGTTGTVSANVLPDSIPLDIDGVHVEQILGRPVFIDPSGSRHVLWLRSQEQRENDLALHIGRPTHYWTEMRGMASGEASQMVLRLWPCPAGLVRLQVNAEWVPGRLRVADIGAAGRLNVPPSMVDDFLNVAGGHLAGAPGFNLVSLQVSQAAASTAVLNLQMRSPVNSTPYNRVGTPAGW
jgi:hypothetical protein